MNTVGIIGGLGPETTADFYLQINQMSLKRQEEIKPSCVISNVQLPYAIEDSLLKSGEGIQEYFPYLKESVTQLENAGVDFIVIPCNTVHVLIEELRTFATVPILSIIEVAKSLLIQAGVKQAFLLATGVTVREGLYSSIGVEWTIPPEEEQSAVDQIIHRLVNGTYTEEDKDTLKNIISQGTVLLACSDLHIAIQDIPGLTVYDTMQILAEATVNTIYEEEIND